MMPVWLSAWSLGPALADHVWQSTLTAGVAALVVRALRRHHARVRYRIWLAASLKFLLPCSLLVGLGSHLPHPATSAMARPDLAVAVETIGQPFSARTEVVPTAPPAPGGRVLPLALVAAWAIGAVAVLLSQWTRSRRLMVLAGRARVLPDGREAAALRRAQHALNCHAPIPLLASPALWEPGVVGILRPAVLWPVGLTDHLSDPQLEAILAHELSHVRRRDNFTAAVHLLVEAIFWFHPLVWWLGSRMIDERERACDEDVLVVGTEPGAYAQGILAVCKFCLQSPVPVIAGVTGANLKQRLEDIMTARVARPLGNGARVLLALVALVLVVGPMAVGAVSADPVVRVAVSAAAARAGLLPETSAALISAVLGDDVQRTVRPSAQVLRPDSVGARRGSNLDVATPAVAVPATEIRDAQTPYDIDRARLTAAAELALEVARRQTAGQVAQTPQTVPDYLDAAKRAYSEGRLADADAALTRALAMLRQQTTTAQTSGDATPLRSEVAALIDELKRLQPSSTVPPLRVGGDIKEPRIKVRVQPRYPQEARDAGIQGYALLEARIGLDGAVTEVKIIKPAPIPAMDQAALDAVSQWLYTPTFLNNVPVEVIMVINVNFALQPQ